MIGTHGVLQTQCSVCIGLFMVNDIIVMRVVEQGINPDTENKVIVFIEYLHDYCTRV